MNIFKTKGNGWSKNQDENNPLKVRAVNNVKAHLSHPVPFLVQSRLRKETTTLDSGKEKKIRTKHNQLLKASTCIYSWWYLLISIWKLQLKSSNFMKEPLPSSLLWKEHYMFTWNQLLLLSSDGSSSSCTVLQLLWYFLSNLDPSSRLHPMPSLVYLLAPYLPLQNI